MGQGEAERTYVTLETFLVIAAVTLPPSLPCFLSFSAID
jgi:hypothetical protein